MPKINLPPLLARRAAFAKAVAAKLASLLWQSRVPLFPLWAGVAVWILSAPSRHGAGFAAIALAGACSSLVCFSALDNKGFKFPLRLCLHIPSLRIRSSPSEALGAKLRKSPKAKFLAEAASFVAGSFLLLHAQFSGSAEWFARHSADPQAVYTRLSLVYFDSVLFFLPIYLASLAFGASLAGWLRHARYRIRLARRNSRALRAGGAAKDPDAAAACAAAPAKPGLLALLLQKLSASPSLWACLLLASFAGILLFWGFSPKTDAMALGAVFLPAYLWACASAASAARAALAPRLARLNLGKLFPQAALLAGWSAGFALWAAFSAAPDFLDDSGIDKALNALAIARDSWGQFILRADFSSWRQAPLETPQQALANARQISPVALWRFWCMLGLPAACLACSFFAAAASLFCARPAQTAALARELAKDCRALACASWQNFEAAAAQAGKTAIASAKAFAEKLLDGKALADAEKSELESLLAPKSQIPAQAGPASSALAAAESQDPLLPSPSAQRPPERKSRNRL